MNKRGTGVIFILVATVLYCTKFISAAIFGSGVSCWSAGLYNEMMSNVGNSLWTWSTIALVIGLFYIIWEDGITVIKKFKDKN